MRKIDAVLAAIIGFLDGIFFYFILRNADVDIPYTWSLPIALAILCWVGIRFASWIGNKFYILWQAAKFFLVGTLNTFIDTGVRNILSLTFRITSGVFYSVFKAISFLVATINSYFWNKYWTFEKRETIQTKEFSKFFIVTAFGLLINVSIASVVVNVVGPQFGLSDKIWATFGDISAAFGAFAWNFFASKFIVFKK
jgi:putative flippase GtrA